MGTLVVRADVAPDGTVAPVRFLTDTLILRPWSEGDPASLRAAVRAVVVKHVTRSVFPQADGALCGCLVEQRYALFSTQASRKLHFPWYFETDKHSTLNHAAAAAAARWM